MSSVSIAVENFVSCTQKQHLLHYLPTLEKMTTDISAAANAAAEAYIAAMALGEDSDQPTATVAEALAKLYLPKFVYFSLGTLAPLDEKADISVGINGHLQRLQKSGLGTDIRCAKFRVDTVSPTSALVHFIWKVFPKKDDIEPFEFLNVYGFRMAPGRPDGLLGGWEFAIGDNETMAIVQRVPDFYSYLEQS